MALPETGPDAKERLIKRDILMILGGATGGSTYQFKDGKFEEVKIQENAEHPDRTIPRPTDPDL